MKRSWSIGLVSAAAVSLAVGCDQLSLGGDAADTPATSTASTPPPTPEVAQPSAEALATNFDAWIKVGEPEVRAKNAGAPDGTMTADTLVLDAGEGLAHMIEGEGGMVDVAITLWGDKQQSIALQLVDWCATGPADVETLPLLLTAEPAEYVISKTFANADACPRFQIIKMDLAGELKAWNPQITRGS